MASTASDGKFKVVVCGGSGGIGQPLSMLMAMNSAVGELVVVDVDKAAIPPSGVAVDLSHLEKPCKVKGFAIDTAKPPIDQLEEYLTGAHLVLVPAGVPRKPDQTRAELFATNAGIARGLVDACAKWCPTALLGLIVNPVNSVVPAMAELYAKKGLDPKKVVGVTTLDVVRANKFVSEATNKPVSDIQIPVIGGHAGETILPLFSQDPIGATLTTEQVPDLDKRTQDGGTEVVKAKVKGSATLSMAYAGARFGYAVLNGLSGTPTTECAYVKSDVHSPLSYFSSKVTFGTSGVEKVHDLGTLSEHEKTRLTAVTDQLKAEIDTGLAYAKDEANNLS